MVFRLVREALVGRTQGELGAAIGCSQSHVAAMAAGRHGASFGVALSLCRLLGKDPSVVLGLDAGSALVADPPALDFLGKLDDVPGLEDWMNEHPQALKLSELVRVLMAWEALPESERHPRKAEPAVGWGKFVARIIERKV